MTNEPILTPHPLISFTPAAGIMSCWLIRVRLERGEGSQLADIGNKSSLRTTKDIGRESAARSAVYSMMLRISALSSRTRSRSLSSPVPDPDHAPRSRNDLIAQGIAFGNFSEFLQSQVQYITAIYYLISGSTMIFTSKYE